MVHHYDYLIQCSVCRKVFPTESGTVLFPISKIRVCLRCNEMIYDKYGHE